MSARSAGVVLVGLVFIGAGCLSESDPPGPRDVLVTPADVGVSEPTPLPPPQPGPPEPPPVVDAAPDNNTFLDLRPSEPVGGDLIAPPPPPPDAPPPPPPDAPPPPPDAGADLVRPDGPPAPPGINPAAIKIMPAGTDFVGGISLGCSYGSSSQRWCAFSRIGVMLSRRELWVANMSVLPPKCDGTSPNCRQLTDDLFTGTPQVGPAYPSAHRWYGDVFVYHARAKSSSTQLYVGPVYAWAIGASSPKQLSGSTNALLCRGHAAAQVALCIEELSTDTASPLTFDLYAGRFDGTNQLQKIRRLAPGHPVGQAAQWGAGFSADGKYFVFSAAPPALPPVVNASPETLYYLPVDQIQSTTQPQPIQVGDPGISVWDVSIDGKRWFYLRDYNYSTVEPSGTLWTADFPTGANPRRLASTLLRSGSSGGVAFYDQGIAHVSDGPDNQRGTHDDVVSTAFLGIMQTYRGPEGGQVGDYVIMKDPAGSPEDPSNVVSMLTGVPGLPSNSFDLRYGAYYLSRAPAGAGATDARIVRNDRSAAPCALTQSPNAAWFGAPFLENAALTFWTDNYDANTQTGDGMLASPTDCVSKKRKFASGIDYWFARRSEALVYTDDVAGSRSTLRFARVTADGSDLGPGEVVQAGIERTFALLPGLRQAMFKMATGNPEVDGIYVVPLP